MSPGPRRRWALAAAVAASVVAVAGSLASTRGGAGRPATGRPPAAGADALATVAPSSGTAAPRAAALAFVAATARLVTASPIGRGETLRTLVTERAYAEQARALDEQLGQLDQRLVRRDGASVSPARLVWVEVPLTVAVERLSPERARARLWTLSLYGAPELGPAETAWRTVRLELVVRDRRWRVDGVSTEAGPTPAPSELALPDGFAPFAEAAAWAPVAPAGLGVRRPGAPADDPCPRRGPR